MNKFKLQPFDVIVVDGLWYMPHHWLIRWRGLDKGVHCCLASNMMTEGQYGIISPEFTGIKMRDISHYAGRRITIHRYNGKIASREAALEWLRVTLSTSTGYDFRQWFLGFLLGLTCRKWVDDSDHWTCAELPYWLYQDLGNVSPCDEVLPMPRIFRYSPRFDVIFDGVWE